MSARVNQCCDQLRDRLNTLDDQLSSLKSNIQELPKRGEQALQQCLTETRSKISIEKQKVEQAKASLKARAEQKADELKNTISEWKAKGNVSRLNTRAELAEQFAVDAVYVAMAALSDAEEAIIDATIARNDANEAAMQVSEVR